MVRQTLVLFHLHLSSLTARAVSDAGGAITLARSYTPWGELLEQHGGGDLTWGYFGGLLDVATGLLYVGNGQYYDPRTGRFLSPRGSGRNPYLPASPGDPLGMLLGTMALGALLARRRRGKGKGDGLLLALGLVLLVSVSGGLLACNRPTPAPVTPQPPSTPPEPVPSPTPSTPSPTPTTPPPSPTPTCTATPMPTPTPGADNRLDTVEERIWAIEQAALTHHGNLPVEIILAIAAAETGPTYNWDNEVANGDGIMQVTPASGHHEEHGVYVNTRTGIEANIQDGIAVLNGYRMMIHSETENNRYGDYGNAFDDFANVEIIRITLHYNGGTNPIHLYAGDPQRNMPPMGTQDYLGRVASRLKSTVPEVFGRQYANSILGEELQRAQVLVNQKVEELR